MSSFETTPTGTPTEGLSFKEKIKTLSFGSVPGGNRQGQFKFRPTQTSSWEAGIAGESRPDGSFWPHLHADSKPIRTKEWAENRTTYERNIRDARNAETTE